MPRPHSPARRPARCDPCHARSGTSRRRRSTRSRRRQPGRSRAAPRHRQAQEARRHGRPRPKAFPKVPTLKERGIDVAIGAWRGLGAPKNMLNDGVDATDLLRVVAQQTVAGPALREAMDTLALGSAGGDGRRHPREGGARQREARGAGARAQPEAPTRAPDRPPRPAADSVVSAAGPLCRWRSSLRVERLIYFPFAPRSLPV